MEKKKIKIFKCFNCGITFSLRHSSDLKVKHHFCCFDCFVKKSSEIFPREKIMGEKNSFFGKHHSLETRLRISKTCKERNIGKWNKGRIPKNVFEKGHIISADTKKRMSLARTGNKNHAWRGGISFEPYSINWDKNKKALIKYRDDGLCQFCGKRVKLAVHHIDYNKKNCSNGNLVSLCLKCHGLTIHNRNFWEEHFKSSLRLKRSQYEQIGALIPFLQQYAF